MVTELSQFVVEDIDLNKKMMNQERKFQEEHDEEKKGEGEG